MEQGDIVEPEKLLGRLCCSSQRTDTRFWTNAGKGSSAAKPGCAQTPLLMAGELCPAPVPGSPGRRAAVPCLASPCGSRGGLWGTAGILFGFFFSLQRALERSILKLFPPFPSPGALQGHRDGSASVHALDVPEPQNSSRGVSPCAGGSEGVCGSKGRGWGTRTIGHGTDGEGVCCVQRWGWCVPVA